MMKKIAKIDKEVVKEISQAKDVKILEQIRIKYIGRKGKISQLLKQIPRLPKSQRPQAGKFVNQLKNKTENLIQSKNDTLVKLTEESARDRIDITLPGKKFTLGHTHPISRIIEETTQIFTGLGFRVVEGPEIETEYYNFEALNIPSEHPSRDMFDTFYIKDDILLRSHTSPVQIRVMEKEKPPLWIVVPGKVFRPDAVDASHSFMFHQIEGLAVDEAIRFSDLKGTLSTFINRMFGNDIKMRFRPHFFPFTEPSDEVDISCIICKGMGCRVC